MSFDRSTMTLLAIRGKRNRLKFKKISPYTIQMTGYQQGRLHMRQCNKEAITTMPPEEGPYLYSGLDTKIIGFEGRIARFDILTDKVEIHLIQ